MRTRSGTRKLLNDGILNIDNYDLPILYRPYKDPLSILPNEIIELLFDHLCHDERGVLSAKELRLVNKAWFIAISTNYVYKNKFSLSDRDFLTANYTDTQMEIIKRRLSRHIARCAYIRSIEIDVHQYNRNFLRDFFFNAIDKNQSKPFETVVVNYHGGPFNSEKKGFLMTITESVLNLNAKDLILNNYSKIVGKRETEISHLSLFEGNLILKNWRLKGDPECLVSSFAKSIDLHGFDVDEKSSQFSDRSEMSLSFLVNCPQLVHLKMDNSNFFMDNLVIKYFDENRYLKSKLILPKLTQLEFTNVVNLDLFFKMSKTEQLDSISIKDTIFQFHKENYQSLSKVTHLSILNCQNTDEDFTVTLFLSNLPRLKTLIIENSPSFSVPILSKVRDFKVKNVVIK